MKVKFSSGSKEVQGYRNWLMLCNDHIHKQKIVEEFTSKFIGQQTHEPKADWQVEKFGGVIIGFMLKFGENTCNYTNTLQEFLWFRFVQRLCSWA
ncbi:hypothetical protein ACE6H2_019042 [Prunus campanulata]